MDQRRNAAGVLYAILGGENMIRTDDNSIFILKRLDGDNLNSIQNKYKILQFEATGYSNNGYNVYYVEVLPLDRIPKIAEETVI